MEIKTKFALGNKLWKIEDSRAVCFKVGCIAFDGNVYYGETPYDLLVESQCFATKAELLRYVDGSTNCN